MSPKEDSEILTIKKACLISVDVFTKYLKDQIMEIIDSDKVNFYVQLSKIISILFMKDNGNTYDSINCRKLNTQNWRKV